MEKAPREARRPGDSFGSAFKSTSAKGGRDRGAGMERFSLGKGSSLDGSSWGPSGSCDSSTYRRSGNQITWMDLGNGSFAGLSSRQKGLASAPSARPVTPRKPGGLPVCPVPRLSCGLSSGLSRGTQRQRKRRGTRQPATPQEMSGTPTAAGDSCGLTSSPPRPSKPIFDALRCLAVSLCENFSCKPKITVRNSR